ncbi:hypothetical protein HOY80DRAFT_1048031 [Tuber brumale]|nr:hypothetical protein HOY80DRAFT_1048031 [Tuber brumale]
MSASPVRGPPIMAVGTDAYNSFEDLSGVPAEPSTATTESSDPYDKLIATCKRQADRDLQKSVTKAYETHRNNRSKQQAEKMLSKHFTGMTVDKTLQELGYAHGGGIVELAEQPLHDSQEIGPRACLTLWVRPTK